MGQGLYEKLVMILQKDSDIKKLKEKIKIYNFKGQSAGSTRWFGLDNDRLK